MPTYDPLIEHLQQYQGSALVLGFDEIEDIIGDRLPPTARRHVAWWANSSARDSHTWAHAWQAAGWKAKVRMANGTAEFTRSVVTAPSVLDALRPTTKRTVMELVSEAGIDVEDWKYVEGRPYPTPASNPNRCYDWSFGTPAEGYVACVWHRSLIERKGRIIYECDIGSHTRKLRHELARTGLTDRQRGSLLKRVRRSEAFEAAVKDSFYSARPLSLILNLGETRDLEDIADATASVSERTLDGEKWYVHEWSDGDATIVRGERPDSLALSPSQNEPPNDSPGEDDRVREGQIRVRQGQAAFRATLLEAYGRKCAITGTRLEPLLEAAHIVPHSEETNYRVSNGLLLRADIHTLYDLYHLSIDERGVIHLSKTARKTDDGHWHGKLLHLPDKSSMAPSPTNLASRHQRFLAREHERP